jgi:hypothetical protein
MRLLAGEIAEGSLVTVDASGGELTIESRPAPVPG